MSNLPTMPNHPTMLLIRKRGALTALQERNERARAALEADLELQADLERQIAQLELEGHYDRIERETRTTEPATR